MHKCIISYFCEIFKISYFYKIFLRKFFDMKLNNFIIFAVFLMIISPVTAMIIADMTGRQEMSLLDDWVRQNAHSRRIIKFR